MNALGRSLWVFPGALGFAALLACSYPPHHHELPAPISSQHKDGHDYVRPSKSGTVTASTSPAGWVSSAGHSWPASSSRPCPSSSQPSVTGVSTAASTTPAPTQSHSGVTTGVGPSTSPAVPPVVASVPVKTAGVTRVPAKSAPVGSPTSPPLAQTGSRTEDGLVLGGAAVLSGAAVLFGARRLRTNRGH
jgi:LPXTG-motif cell wall-anchored protein